MNLFRALKHKPKDEWAILLGYLSESYNGVVFGFFSVIIAPLFFPQNKYTILSGFGTFAAGYLMRPFGGTIFGYIGDRYGRKAALKTSILFLAVPALIISILPTYQTIGIYAPIILIAARLLQGLSHGGDYSGAIIYVFEKQAKNKISQTCFMVASGFFGGCIASTIGALTSYDFFPEWAWRLPFFIEFFGAMTAFMLRSRMQETEAFQHMEKKLKISLIPYIRPYIAALILGGANLVPIYINIVYMNQVLHETLSFSKQQVLFTNLGILFLSIWVILFTAIPIRRYGSEKVMKAAMIILAIASPLLFHIGFHTPFIPSILSLQLYLLVGNAVQITAMTFYFPKLFPTQVRYRALGLSIPVGQAIIGGTTPLFCLMLVEHTGYQAAPGFYLALISGISLLSLKLIREKPQTLQHACEG